MANRPKIACLGDSLTMGFQSGAIRAARSEWSYPAVIARAMGLEIPLDFRVPRIPGPGLPLDIEGLLHFLHRELGSEISTGEWIARFPFLARRFIDEVEDYYERGGGTLPSKFRGLYHNLAVWGFTVREALDLTPRHCRQAIQAGEGFIDDDFLGIPSAPMYRTALRVLDASNQDSSQLGTFERLCSQEPVDVVLLWLGANDCLGSVLTLELNDMANAHGEIPNDPMKRLKWNLTSGEVFARDYGELSERVRRASPNAKVFVATIPYVTIPPVTTGLGARVDGYYERYGRFFVNDQNFNPRLKHLTRADAKLIDARIDAFNVTIRKAAAKHGFHVVDMCQVLSRLAVKRNGFEQEPAQALRSYYAELPDHPLLKLDPIPSALNFSVDKRGLRVAGGLFSLDGAHPTNLGYGLIAEAFLQVMQDAGLPGADPARVPWASLIAQDSLHMAAPRVWDDVMKAASEHATLWDLVFRALA